MLVEGVDYTPEGIEAIREELINMRADMFRQWPDKVHSTVVLTHAIILLAHLRDQHRET